MNRKLRVAVQLLREKGPGKLLAVVCSRVWVAGQVLLRGAKRTVTIDGCQFYLGDLPNNMMKLALQKGLYEAPEREAVRKYMQPNWGVVELGACIGVVSCVTNKLLRNPAAHVVIELNPMAVPHLIANRQRNNCSFKVLNCALAYDANQVSLSPHLEFWGNFLHQAGTRPPVSVPVTQLERILNDEGFDEFAVICDVEGQEIELLKHEMETLRKASLIIMELHPHMIGGENSEMILSALAQEGFQVERQSANIVVFTNVPRKPVAAARESAAVASSCPLIRGDGTAMNLASPRLQ